MITLEVGKTYMMDTGMRVECIRRSANLFLMVSELGNPPVVFWVDVFSGYGLGDEFNDAKIEKEVVPRQASAGWVNVYRDNDGELCIGEFWPSLDEAKAASACVSVGIVPVILVNNIETGEVDG